MSVELHLEVLKQLTTILPGDSQVILLGDGEFDGYQLQAFNKKEGWKYALRTAKHTTITTAQGETLAIGALYPMSEHDHWLLEGVSFTHKGYGPVNVLDHPGKGCHREF